MIQTNRRQKQRLPLNTPIHEFAGVEKINGTTINLSEEGICYCRKMKSSTRQRRGTQLTLSLKTPTTNQIIYVSGEVVHEIVEDDFIITGVAFNKPDLKIVQSIKEILNKEAATPKPYYFFDLDMTQTQ